MKQAMITKGIQGAGLLPDDLAQINRYTRRTLAPEEVYVFPLVLCDNEIDRDGERFTVQALYRLKRLFLGKTGIFDHNPEGRNQTARIFSTAVEQDKLRTTGAGEVYHFLTARAYMVRSEKNRDLILEIDAGIKKEVSVGCAVAIERCSVCGKDVRREPCAHQPGRSYGGAVCHRILDEPTDAYEWSFVAVPAQPAAGVTKALAAGGADVAERLKRAQGPLGLSLEEAKALGAELARLQTLAQAGEQALDGLRREVLRAAALCGADTATIAGMSEKLSPDELRSLKKALTQRVAPLVQLSPGSAQAEEDNRPFFI